MPEDDDPLVGRGVVEVLVDGLIVGFRRRSSLHERFSDGNLDGDVVERLPFVPGVLYSFEQIHVDDAALRRLTGHEVAHGVGLRESVEIGPDDLLFEVFLWAALSSARPTFASR